MTATVGFPLSPQQSHLWRQLGDAADAPRTWCAVSVPAQVGVDRLRTALFELAGRHEILRTTVTGLHGVDTAVQVIADRATDVLVEVDRVVGSAVDLSDRTAQDGPLRAVTAPRRDGRRAVLLSADPSCADARSLRLLAAELDAWLGGDTPPADPPTQFADVAQWQSDLLADPDLSIEREFWTGRSLPAGAGSVPFVGAGDGPPAADTRTADTRTADTRTVDVPTRPGTTPSAALAAWCRVLARVGTDVVVGIRADTRSVAADLADAIGPYTVHLPLAADRVGPRTDTGELQELWDAMQHHAGYFDPRALPGRDAGLVAGFAWPADDAQPGHGLVRVEACGEGGAQPAVVLVGRGTGLGLDYDPRRCVASDLAVLADDLADDLAAELANELPDEPSAPRRAPVPTVVRVASDEPVHLVVARHARSRPDALAVLAGPESLTYADLAGRVDRLAGRLVDDGCRPGDVVGLCLPRGADMVVGILAVLTVGAAYLPIDVDQPQRRRDQLLGESGARLVLTDTATPTGAVSPPSAAVDIDGAWPAYLMFTSGSSGTPKGVRVPHAALAAYAASMRDRAATVIGRDDPLGWAMVSSFAADLGGTALWGALATGGTLRIADATTAVDPARLADLVTSAAHGRVDAMKIVPSHLRALLSSPRAADLLPARLLVLGGEACDWDLVDRVRSLAPGLRVLNHYGPTETTVGVLTHELDGPADRRPAHAPPLGRALPHAAVSVVDHGFGPTRTWEPGEIVIGGASVADGYWRRPAATADRFVPDPCSASPGARCYRTGDLGRRLADGAITFLGRSDDQLSVHGHRVEPGEVAATLRTHPEVVDAMVTAVPASAASAGDTGAPATGLAAYLALRPGTATTADVLDEVRGHARDVLPEHLVPVAWATVAALPRNGNGKIDRTALAAIALTTSGPATSGPATADTDTEPPRAGTETTLAQIWTDVLGLRATGRTLARHDNFFGLGGDSILSIQVVGRAGHAGIAITPRLLFEHPTVAGLAEVVGHAAAVPAEQGLVQGSFPPAPVQQWFLDRALAAPHHYNQAVSLRTAAPVPAAVLRRAAQRLLAQHDALRLQLDGGDGNGGDGAAPSLTYVDPDPTTLPVTTVDLGAVAGPARRGIEQRLVAATHAGFDLGRGPLLRVLHVTAPDGSDAGDRVLLVAHHLAVDGVSWRILLDDLATACSAPQDPAGLHTPLPGKTSSYAEYARHVAARATSAAVADQVSRWLAEQPGPADVTDVAPGTVGDAREHVDELDAATTARLLAHSAGVDRRTDLLDVVLAALLVAAERHGWTSPDRSGGPALVVDLEHHGRDTDPADLDVTRTVGWFTVIHPLRLSVGSGADARQRREAVRRARDTLPGQGRDFPLLRHHHAAATIAGVAELRARPLPAIRVNHLGVIRAPGPSGPAALFVPSADSPGPTSDPRNARPYLLDLTTVVRDDRLTITWTHPAGVDVTGLAAELVAELAEHARPVDPGPADPAAAAPRPGDFPLAGIDQTQLDAITAALGRRRR